MRNLLSSRQVCASSSRFCLFFQVMPFISSPWWPNWEECPICPGIGQGHIGHIVQSNHQFKLQYRTKYHYSIFSLFSWQWNAYYKLWGLQGCKCDNDWLHWRIMVEEYLIRSFLVGAGSTCSSDACNLVQSTLIRCFIVRLRLAIDNVLQMTHTSCGLFYWYDNAGTYNGSAYYS